MGSAPLRDMPLSTNAPASSAMPTARAGEDERRYLAIGIVDDDEGLAGFLAAMCLETFGPANVVLQATKVADAEDLFEAAPELDVVLVDGYIPCHWSDGMEVIARLRHAGYTGPIIAISSDPDTRTLMVKHDPAANARACAKYDVIALAELVHELVGGD